jgi:hypothetical protein
MESIPIRKPWFAAQSGDVGLLFSSSSIALWSNLYKIPIPDSHLPPRYFMPLPLFWEAIQICAA